MTVPKSWLGPSCLTLALDFERQGLSRLAAISRACAYKYGTPEYFEMHRSERAMSGWAETYLEICNRLSVDTLGKAVLVVGINDGSDIEFFKSCRVIGIDPCAEALATARASMPHHSFHVGLAESLPLPDRSVDSYIALRVFNCSTIDLDLAMGEFRRVLKPAGSFIFSVANGFYEGDRFISGLFQEGVVNPDAPRRIKEDLSQRLRRFGIRASTAESITETFFFGVYDGPAEGRLRCG